MFDEATRSAVKLIPGRLQLKIIAPCCTIYCRAFNFIFARVPLFIAHPLSPHKGQHYTAPVELLDVFPTVLDLLQAPSNYSDVCVGNTICHPLQGNSLARIVLGDEQFESLRHRSGLKGE